MAPTGPPGPVQPPIHGELRITSKYGDRMHPVTHAKTFHHGVDFAAEKGRSVYAVASGRIDRAHRWTGKPEDAGGTRIEILHANGWRTRYMHLDRMSDGLTVGDTVAAGYCIGAAGQSGRCTGPHLHFEVRAPDGSSVDPTPWVDGKAPASVG